MGDSGSGHLHPHLHLHEFTSHGLVYVEVNPIFFKSSRDHTPRSSEKRCSTARAACVKRCSYLWLVFTIHRCERWKSTYQINHGSSSAAQPTANESPAPSIYDQTQCMYSLISPWVSTGQGKCTGLASRALFTDTCMHACLLATPSDRI